jgi:hypothetical protein
MAGAGDIVVDVRAVNASSLGRARLLDMRCTAARCSASSAVRAAQVVLLRPSYRPAAGRTVLVEAWT